MADGFGLDCPDFVGEFGDAFPFALFVFKLVEFCAEGCGFEVVLGLELGGGADAGPEFEVLGFERGDGL